MDKYSLPEKKRQKKYFFEKNLKIQDVYNCASTRGMVFILKFYLESNLKVEDNFIK